MLLPDIDERGLPLIPETDDHPPLLTHSHTEPLDDREQFICEVREFEIAYVRYEFGAYHM